MTLQPRLTDVRREQVQRAALECLVERGFRGPSVKDIAEHAGVSTGSLYHYFANKDDILLQALAMAFREADAALREQVESAPHAGAEGRLPRYLQAAATMGRDHSEATRALMAALGHTGASTEVRDRLARLFGGFRSYAYDLLLEDAGAGAIPADSPVPAERQAVAALIVAMGIGLACQWAVDPQAVDPDAAGEAFQRLWHTAGAGDDEDSQGGV